VIGAGVGGFKGTLKQNTGWYTFGTTVIGI
jgi:hypothetical protein